MHVKGFLFDFLFIVSPLLARKLPENWWPSQVYEGPERCLAGMGAQNVLAALMTVTSSPASQFMDACKESASSGCLTLLPVSAGES